MILYTFIRSCHRYKISLMPTFPYSSGHGKILVHLCTFFSSFGIFPMSKSCTKYSKCGLPTVTITFPLLFSIPLTDEGHGTKSLFTNLSTCNKKKQCCGKWFRLNFRELNCSTTLYRARHFPGLHSQNVTAHSYLNLPFLGLFTQLIKILLPFLITICTVYNASSANLMSNIHLPFWKHKISQA